jgi:FKBP-type peptidyl-prolyl cis-trans isomerase
MRTPAVSPLLLFVLALPACGPQGGPPSLETESQKAGYALGVQTGDQLRPADPHIDLEALLAGIRDGMSGEEPALSPEEINTLLQSLTGAVNQQMMEEEAAEAARNESEGASFLAENLKKEGVVATASGLQYEVLQEGTEVRPTPEDQVSIHYRMALLDGTEFDSSYESGEPAAIGVTAVIPGFSEGLQLMTVGSRYRFYIPPELAYGRPGSPPNIGPNATLVFEVELLEIVQQ